MLRRIGFTLFLAISCIAARAQDRPNIVLVMADDQGWGDMAYNGHKKLHTPNFDRAAANGIRFDRFYAAAPVCSPTRASVMTGRTPNRMGVFKWGYPMRPQETTIAEALQEAGYATAHFGKWHLGSVRRDSPANPGKNGFDHWVSAPNFFDNDPILSDQGEAKQFSGESSMVTVDLANQWIASKSKGEQPFFAVVWFGSPHSPHQASEADLALYPDEKKALQNFYGEISGMDKAFGELIAGLEKNNVRDNTVLWYCSDNGALPQVGSTGGFRGRKADVYEGGLLVPSILQWPAKIEKPQVIATRCTTSDIFPTVLELAGVDRKSTVSLDGVSLKPLLADGEMVSRAGLGFWDFTAKKGHSTPSAKLMKELFDAQADGGDLQADEISQNAAKHPEPKYENDSFPGHAAWISGNWKVHRIQRGERDVKWELYDLATDPYEKKDLSGEQADQLKAMQSSLNAWLNSVVDSLNGKDYKN